MPGPNSPYTQLDANQVLQQSFDETNDRLRVDAAVSATISDIEIKDPDTGNTLHINADGSIDTNVVISAASDSIKISDGVDTMAVNADGSINVQGTVSGTVTTNESGLANIQTTQYTVGTSSVQLTPSPLANRKSISIKAHTTSVTELVYIGNSSGVTTSTGYPLFDGDSLQIDLTAANNLYVIGTLAGQKVYVLEIG